VGIISWIVLGLVAGLLARLLGPSRGVQGCLPTLVVGIVGALIGGFIATALGADDGVTGFNLWSILLAVIGAVLFLLVLSAFSRRR
jgi:uncharacterized membrane protein YeaQ/YmgE (transglycosylase-associated protein family)